VNVSAPGVSVVIASHGRPLRLRWLLNALEEQTLDAERWEAIVVHDYGPATAARVLESHPLARAGRLRHVAIRPGTGSAPGQRNIGWRQARGTLIAFIDDDCRPDLSWLEKLTTTAERHPHAFVQGATRPDPFERDVFAAPHVRTLRSEPPNRYAQTCNTMYPTAVLERVGGFDEATITGEDIDLSLRARATGANHVAAPGAAVFHAVEAMTLGQSIRDGLWWQHLALVVKGHPELRRTCLLRVFWEPEHALVALALTGVAAAARRPRALALALPWLASEWESRGRRPAALAVNAVELPGRLVREGARVLTLAAGSARYRTVLL
jgi:GT2 family glycosyltransferase